MISELHTRWQTVLWLGALISIAGQLCTTAESQQHLQDLNKALLQAADKGDYRSAEAALKRGADPNARVPGTWLNYTPLLMAIEAECNTSPAAINEKRKIVELLLDWGADPYARDENENEAIDHAKTKAKEPILELLLSRGVPLDPEGGDLDILLKYADPNERTKNWGRWLISAAFADSPQDLQLLLDHGADINAQDDDGNTALLTAIYQSREKAAAFLIKAGANSDIQNKAGESAVSTALGYRTNTASILIERGANVNLANASGKTLLMEAASNGALASLNLLLSRGADVHAKTQTGETAVHFAAGVSGYDWDNARSVENRRNPIQIIDSLEAHGADLNALNSAGQSALHFAADTGYAGTINKLLDKNLDPRVADNHGDTPLHKAIASHSEDKVEKVKLLLGSGINTPNSDGDTPLHIAATKMEATISLALLDKGAAVDQPNNIGEIPLLIAASAFNRQYVDAKAYSDIIRLFATRTSVIDQRDSHKMTAAMWAAASNIPEALEAIVAQGADVDARSDDGRNCLMWAASANAKKAIQILLHHGADAHATDTAGRTAAEWARLLQYEEASQTLEQGVSDKGK